MLVKLEIFNCLGEKITSLIDYKMNKGLNSYIFDAINLSNGIYYYRIQSGSFSQTKKMILLK